MYVCLCKGITDKAIKAEIANGAQSLKEISRRLGVCTNCGRCGKTAKSILDESLTSLAYQAA